jgi:GDP/UDP-N,N'-diacetylbacillosamine 2-epimerase (hydrolysing)
MHLLPGFGESVKDIVADGFEVRHRLYMALDGYNQITTAKSMGTLLNSLADLIAGERPDWIVLAGDRAEQLMGAVAAAYCYIPVAHIQAGELSGNIDGMARHAIGKLVHLHFASNKDAAGRLIKLGEEPFRVHNVGAPQVDELVQGLFTGRQEFEARHGFSLGEPFILFVQHPVTEEFAHASEQIELAMAAMARFPQRKVVILPNNDAGSHMIRQGIEKHRNADFFVFANLRREDYLCLMKHAVCMVGNSSSGLLEAPSFNLPAVNLGRRQNQRVRGINVIDAEFDAAAIADAVRIAMSEEFRRRLAAECVNPYGDGRSSERILQILADTPVTDELLVKNLTY